jgi:hypothetical protein
MKKIFLLKKYSIACENGFFEKKRSDNLGYIQISDHFQNRNQYESARRRNLCEVNSLISYESLEDTTKKNKQKNKQYLSLRHQRLCFVF